MVEKIFAYCFRCKKLREMINPIKIEIKGKRNLITKALTAKCPVCGTKLFRILGRKRIEQEAKEEVNTEIQKNEIEAITPKIEETKKEEDIEKPDIEEEVLSFEAEPNVR